MTRPNEEATKFVREAFASLWPVHLSGFIRLLIQLREAFDDDIDLMIVLAAIGERTRPESWQPEPITYRQITRRKGEEYLQMPINMQSVSDFTGIPRETVRRKIQFLEKKGWVKRDADGRLTISGTAAVELEKSTIHSIEYLAAISNAVLEVNRREASISSI